MDFAPKDILRLNHDPEFQRRIDQDPELDRLMTERDAEPAMIEAELLMFLGAVPSLGKIQLKRPSAADVSWLWLIKSPYVIGGKTSAAHVDAALWLLADIEHGEITSVDGIMSASTAFCLANDIEYASADKAIDKILKLSFMGLDYLPSEGLDESKRAPDFDCEWLTRVAGMAMESGLIPNGRSLRELIRDVPLIELNYLCVQTHRKRGGNVGKKHKLDKVFDWIKKMMRQRLDELAAKTAVYHQNQQTDDHE